jgi:DNA methylase
MSIKPSIDLVLLADEFLQGLVKAKIVFEKLKERAIEEGIDGEALKVLLQSRAKRLQIPRTTFWRYMKELEDSTLRNVPFGTLDTQSLQEPDIQLYNESFIDSKQRSRLENSVDLIFTDPLYGAKYVHLYKDLAEFAMFALKEGGSLVSYIGHVNIRDALNFFEDAGLIFQWKFAIEYSGPTYFPPHVRIGSRHKDLFWYAKSLPLKAEFPIIFDLIKSENPDKSKHPYAQSDAEAYQIIENRSFEGDLVVDPFLGYGTTAKAARALRRRFIGFEIDSLHFSNAKQSIMESL